MKSIKNLFVVITLIMVISFLVISCEEESMEGTTWKAEYDGVEYTLKFTSQHFTIGEILGGSYTVSGNKLTTVMEMGGEEIVTIGTLSGNSLALTVLGNPLVFIKQ